MTPASAPLRTSTSFLPSWSVRRSSRAISICSVFATERAAGEAGAVEAVSAQDVQQVLGLDSSVKVTLPKMDGFGDYTVTVPLHKQVKVELPLKLVEA